jgi:8-oxo-dGTP pyrophosphatase MutT (NUDIX family)
MYKNINTCNNCGKQGHLFHQCRLPTTSYGIILLNITLDSLLMIRRKDSFGYIDFIRGKYTTWNFTQLLTIIDEMSLEEKNKIMTLSFDVLWDEMWGELSLQHKSEKHFSKKKFDNLKEGIIMNDKLVTFNDFVQMSETSWKETEWEFPKGRRNQKEKEFDCALREFEEETGISKDNITIIENLLPFEEIFIGSNHKSYKHKYFLAVFNQQNTDLNNYQKTEVSKLEWKTFDECLESIRPYNLEKKELIININKILQEYRLYL